MVFIVYNPQNNFMTGVYEDEKDAYYAIEFLDETEYKYFSNKYVICII